MRVERTIVYRNRTKLNQISMSARIKETVTTRTMVLRNQCVAILLRFSKPQHIYIYPVEQIEFFYPKKIIHTAIVKNNYYLGPKEAKRGTFFALLIAKKHEQPTKKVN